MEPKKNLPLRNSSFRRGIGRGLLHLLRWEIEGEIPDVPKAIVLGGPHSSNWDWIIGISAVFELDLELSWWGKESLFRWPFGSVMRSLGGLPVKRSGKYGQVEQIVAEFERRDRFLLALAPTGTRRAGAAIKSGFYHIAKGAQVPILPIYLDNARQRIGFGDLMHTDKTLEEAVEQVRSFYVQFPRR